MNVTPIAVVTIDPELIENLIDMEKIDVESDDDCTDESVLEFLESSQEHDSSVTAELVKVRELAKVTFAMSEWDSALRVMKAVADNYSFRNLRLEFIHDKPKKNVGYLMSVIRPAAVKALVESELYMDKSDLKRDLLEFIAYLEKMAIIHDKHCHVVDNMKTSDSGTENVRNNSYYGG
jgi:hypothetical protein